MCYPVFRIPDTCCPYCGIGSGHHQGCPETIRDEKLKKEAEWYHNRGYDDAIKELRRIGKLSEKTGKSFIADNKAYRLGRSKAECLWQMSSEQREALDLSCKTFGEQAEVKRVPDHFSGPSPCVKALKS